MNKDVQTRCKRNPPNKSIQSFRLNIKRDLTNIKALEKEKKENESKTNQRQLSLRWDTNGSSSSRLFVVILKKESKKKHNF